MGAPFNLHDAVHSRSKKGNDMSPQTTYSRLIRSMIVIAVLIASAAFLLSPPTTHADTVPLYSFNGSDGANPIGGLVQGSDGSFYGTTQQAGAGGAGTVFKITSSGSLTTLYSFSGSDGSYLFAGLVQGSDGSFYGTTAFGGANNLGTVFKITSDGCPDDPNKTDPGACGCGVADTDSDGDGVPDC